MGKYFFCNKTKTEPFLENLGHSFIDIEKNFSKTTFQINLISYRTVGAPRNIEANWTQIWSNLHDKYSIASQKKCSETIRYFL